MGVEVTSLSIDADADRWNRVVQRAAGTHPLYHAAAIEAQARETGTVPHLLVGHVGEEPVGLFPVFEYRRGPFKAAFSPPPRSWSCFLGPALVTTGSMKRRTADKRAAGFIEECLEWIDERMSPLYSKYVLAMEDVRPFLDGFAAEPDYTYLVELPEDPDTLLERFSSDARRKIRRGKEGDVEVTEGGSRDVERIVEQVTDRYESQGREFHVEPGYVRSLYETLGAGAIRPYVCRVDGAFEGGILVLESETTRYRWLGGVRPDEGVDAPVNELLDWQVMCDGIEQGLDRYDLVGAGVSSINEYKAKFNPSLALYYTVTAGSYGLDLVVDRYRKIG